MSVEQVYCGGFWDFEPRDARVAGRYWDEPVDRFNYLGLRLARTPGQRMAP